MILISFFFFQAEDGIRDVAVTGVQTCALPISSRASSKHAARRPASGPARAEPAPSRERRPPTRRLPGLARGGDPSLDVLPQQGQRHPPPPPHAGRKLPDVERRTEPPPRRRAPSP